MRHGCGDCAHNGKCDGLPYCGGLAWVSAYAECARCGAEMLAEDMATYNGLHYCGDCAAEIEAEAESEVRDGE